MRGCDPGPLSDTLYVVVSPDSSESELLPYIETTVRMSYVTGLRSLRKVIALSSPELVRTGTEDPCVLRHPD